MINKLKNWIIKKLGGVLESEVEDYWPLRYKEEVGRLRMLSNKAEREEKLLKEEQEKYKLLLRRSKAWEKQGAKMPF